MSRVAERFIEPEPVSSWDESATEPPDSLTGIDPDPEVNSEANALLAPGSVL